MRWCLAAATLGIVLASVVSAADTPLGPGKPAPAPPPAKQPVVRVEWRTDLEAAKKEATESGRMVFIFFSADWCQPCKLMEGGTFVQRVLTQYLEAHYVPVKVDDTKDKSEVTKKYEVRLYPSILILGPDNAPLHMVLGPYTATQLYPILQQVAAIPQLLANQKKAPYDSEANFAIGNALAALDHLRRAEPYLRKVVELDPRKEGGRLRQTRLMLAMVPLEDGDSDQTLKNLAAFLDEFPGSPEAPTALYYVGAVLFRDGKLLEARRAFEAVRTKFPKDLKAYDADRAIEMIDVRLRAQAEARKAAAEKKPPAEAPKNAPDAPPKAKADPAP
jgi:tetratricopeptide (TPR) repeat protein